MKHVFRRLAAVVAIAVSAGAAQAEMINFEQPVDSPNAPFAPFLTHDDVFLQGSYYFNTFSNAANAQFGDLVGAMVNGRAPFDAKVAADSSAIVETMSKLPWESFDASFIGGMGATLPPVAGLLRLQGFTSTGATLTQTYQLAGPNASGALGFGSYQTTGTFASTQFETVFAFGFTCNTGGTCNAFSTDRGQFALDNISVTAVPEPETIALFGLGLLAVGAAVRRRRQSAKGSV